MPKEKIMIFIDNSNIFKGFKKYKIMADYEKLKNIITGDRELISIRLYEGIVYPINPLKKKWYEDLNEKSGYIVITSFDKKIPKSSIEKKIDVKIAIDIISFAYEDCFDTAILVSGDGDFLPIVEKLENLNKKLEIWAFSYSLANIWQNHLPKENIFYLDNILSKLNLKS